VKLAEHDRAQPIWVLGHMGIDGNEMGREVAIVDWIRKHEEVHIRRKAGYGISQQTVCEKAWEVLSLSRNQLRIMTRLLRGQCN